MRSSFEMPPTSELPRRATVWWIDAHGDAESEMSAEDIDKRHRPALQATTGWVIRSDKIGVTLVMVLSDFLSDGYILSSPYRYREFIPRQFIKRVQWWSGKE